MNGRFQMPLAPTHGMMFDVFSHNPIDGAGSIMFKYDYSTGQTFHSYSGSETDAVTYNNEFILSNTGRRHYKVIYLVNGNLKEWHVRRVSTDITAAEKASIATNAKRHFKFFPNDEASYALANANDHYQIPSGYHKVELVYGTGEIDSNTASTLHGVRVRLPETPSDGDVVSIHTAHRNNSGSAGEVIFIEWVDTANIPSTRRMFQAGGVVKTAQEGDDRIECQSHPDQRHEFHWRYVSSADAWIFRKDGYA